jgi:hypothetical protein
MVMTPGIWNVALTVLAFEETDVVATDIFFLDRVVGGPEKKFWRTSGAACAAAAGAGGGGGGGAGTCLDNVHRGRLGIATPKLGVAVSSVRGTSFQDCTRRNVASAQ